MLERIFKQKTLLNTIFIAIVFGGLMSYINLGKLEDAEIKIKSAMILTPYPGATAHEVELELTDVLEKTIQKLENVKEIKSTSKSGLSQITVEIDEKVNSKDIAQIWDHLRRKVGDISSSLPQGAMEPIVNDDFGDVYGIFITVTADGYDYDELYDYVDLLRREFLDVEGIKRVELFGVQKEVVDIQLSAEKLANLSINPMVIVQAINDEGLVVNTGSIVAGTERIRLSIGNKFASIQEIENILIQIPDGGSFRLADLVTIKRDFLKPRTEILEYNGKRAISLAISMESGVNVINVGKNYDKKLTELYKILPAGIEVNSVFMQPDRVHYSIRGFVVNLIQSILIVIVVLLLAMGIRSGLLIASGLIFTILGSFILMLVFDIQLQRISLAAIIVSMGMLVDNAIVIVDGIIMDLKRGKPKKEAYTSIVKRTAIPLLGATIIAILAFMPLAMSPDSAGEYLGSLFKVLAISLFLSWVFAMVQTPYIAAIIFKNGVSKKQRVVNGDPYSTPFYLGFKRMLQWALNHKTLFLTGSVIILLFAFYSFRFVRFQHMPLLDYNQFVIEYKLANGSDIEAVRDDLHEISGEILAWDIINNVTASCGRTPSRYSLLRPISTGGSYYGEMIIDVDDYDASVIAGDMITNYLKRNYPHAETRKRLYGPVSNEYEIEVQFIGPDPDILRNLSEQAKAIMLAEPFANSITDNWKNKVKTLYPEYSVEKARKVSVSRADVANALAIATEGIIVGMMNDGNTNLPIRIKLSKTLDENIDQIANYPVWGMYNEHSVPLGQVTEELKLKWENEEIKRFNGQRAILVQCDPISGVLTPELEAKLKPLINAIQIPAGYSIAWKGSGEDSAESQSNLFKFLPLALGLMLIIIIALFNNIKQALIIFSIFPFAFIGIVFGFVTTQAVFNFIGIIGSLGLIGMMIKNSIVLLDEINQNIKNGVAQLQAIVNATISRMRPVILASATTILGMIPLLFDVMFKSMAITIIFGLLFGTMITLFVVPVMYAIFFKVDTSINKI